MCVARTNRRNRIRQRQTPRSKRFFATKNRATRAPAAPVKGKK